MNGRRFPVALVTIAGIAGLVAVGRHEPASIDPTFALLGDPTMPFVPTGSFVSSSWLCPGVPLGQPGEGGSVVVANPSDVPLAGTLTVFTDAAGVAKTTTSFSVPARDLLATKLADVQPAGTFLSALVEVTGGGGFVEQRADHPSGSAVSACSNSTSSNWYFADGFTADGSTENLVVTNPFPNDAVVGFRFATAAEVRTPPTLQSRVVKGNSVLVVPIADVVRDEKVLAATVTATRGRIVVGRSELFAGPDRAGYAMSLGAPSLSGQVYFADGEASQTAKVVEQYSLYNPGSQDVVVNAVFLGVPAADTFVNTVEIPVPAGRVVSWTPSGVTGLPIGRHGLAFASLNDPTLVVERVLTRPAGDKTATTVVLGAPSRFAVHRWSMAVGTDLALDDVLVVLNVDGAPGTVTVKSLGPGGEVAVPGLESLPIDANAVLSISFKDPASLGRPIVVESSTRIFVERLLPRGKSLRGRSGSFGLPG